MSDLTGVKVGDKLFVQTSNHDKGHIVVVDRVTPSGRVITKFGEFNPNGLMRGGTQWSWTRARLANEDDIAGVYRYRLVRKLEEFRLWDKLSAEDLKTVSEIVAKYNSPL